MKKIGLLMLFVFTFGLLLIIRELSLDGSDSSAIGVTVRDDAVKSIPAGSVHWHPRLTIKINGEAVPIPSDIGITIGQMVDTELSGMRMSPTHTHESDGTIHLENLNPRSKPETLTLGYFFHVWGKPFNSTCIFDYCTSNGTLTMYVNGQENNEFQNYLMHDKDEIVIEYDSKD
jgi:hypothetical protein